MATYDSVLQVVLFVVFSAEMRLGMKIISKRRMLVRSLAIVNNFEEVGFHRLFLYLIINKK